MANILVFIQQNEGKVSKVSRTSITAAREYQSAINAGKIMACCFGPAAAQAADEVLALGVDHVYYSEAAELKNYLSTSYSDGVIAAVKESGADTVICTATTTGKDLMPRVAVAMDAGQASDILGVNPDGTFKRPLYAGDVIADVEILTPRKVITTRATAFAPAETTTPTGAKSELKIDFNKVIFTEFVSYETSESERPELGDADVVVSGGRALKSAETFMEVMAPLADVFGAAIGASRAAVDSGYAPNDWQVGQTGKVVAPSLYLAVGISGAIQHLAGMKDSKVIVAINKDPEAPIFEVADYGLVADLYEAVPRLVEEVKKVKS